MDPDVPTRVSGGCTAVVWDFDGVVADTEPVHQYSYEVVLATFGAEVSGDWFRQHVGSREATIWQRLVTRHQLALPVDELMARRAEVYQELSSTLLPAWFVEPVLALDVRHTVVSSGNHGQITLLLERWGLADRFDAVLATGSPAVPPGQPKAERLAARLTGPGVMVFEDAPRYLAQARAAGARTVGVAHRLNDLADARCDVVVDHQRPGTWS